MYCTRGDIEKILPADVLLRLTDLDSDGQEDTGIVDRAIGDAGAIIDGYASVRYSTPFDPVPAQVRACAVSIAVYKLFARRGYDEDSADKAVVAEYRDAVTFLRDVGTGKAALAVATEDPQPVPDRVHTVTRPQVFGGDGLDGFGL